MWCASKAVKLQALVMSSNVASLFNFMISSCEILGNQKAKPIVMLT